LTRHAANLADPLHPKLSTELAPGDPNGSATVYVHFEQPASGPGFNAGELTQAEHVQAETGEEVHFFGKDALLRDYPVIDGTIGDPRRPMQLKQTHAVDGASGARYQAQTALEAARVGSTKAIEVYIEALDFTRAQVEGAWGDPMVGRARGGGGVPSAPVFDGAIIGKIVVTCKGGERMVITPGATTFTYL
jgi:hypothetical protein